MHKKLISELHSIAHDILKIRSKGNIATLKERVAELYDKVSLLAYIDNYVDTTPQISVTKSELLNKFKLEDQDISNNKIVDKKVEKKTPKTTTINTPKTKTSLTLMNIEVIDELIITKNKIVNDNTNDNELIKGIVETDVNIDTNKEEIDSSLEILDTNPYKKQENETIENINSVKDTPNITQNNQEQKITFENTPFDKDSFEIPKNNKINERETDKLTEINLEPEESIDINSTIDNQTQTKDLSQIDIANHILEEQNEWFTETLSDEKSQNTKYKENFEYSDQVTNPVNLKMTNQVIEKSDNWLTIERFNSEKSLEVDENININELSISEHKIITTDKIEQESKSFFSEGLDDSQLFDIEENINIEELNISDHEIITTDSIQKECPSLSIEALNDRKPLERDKNIKRSKGTEKASLEEMLQGTFSVDIMANLFQKVDSKRSLNDTIADNEKTIKIDLNDRIALVKHLFNGDTETFNNAVTDLNNFKTFQEALNYVNYTLKPNYDWSIKEFYEERLIELIERKFN